ncbi:rrp15p protein [Tasmannia lanceolata]|uniref:rrp15p protein n=1 Tax=Tasmannia lanceolata TaxID=3420 RepID=UPI0040634F56
MATTEINMSEPISGPKKRKLKQKNSKARKRPEVYKERGSKMRTNKKMRKLFEKRAKEYNSDEDESGPEDGDPNGSTGNSSEDEGVKDLDAQEDMGGSEDEGDGIQHGITKFTDGCRAFRMAFKKIMKKNVSSDALGPVLSGHKKLIAEKLADEEAERKVKGEAKKEKHLVREKGHVKPANFLDTKEKFLLSVATKGVVKLFNAVNKAQNAQKGLNPSRSKDAKVLGKQRKQAFLAELRKTSAQATDSTSLINYSKDTKFTRPESNGEPGWAPLRDSYMLTDSKLKDWDKMPDPASTVVPDEMPLDYSTDDE